MQLVITGDGSHTLFVPELNEHYHSTFGAVTESRHIFIEAGLLFFKGKEQLTVFEVGFGTGLNALLTCIASVNGETGISYYALEKYPVGQLITDQLNYSSVLPSNIDTQGLLMAIHQAAWNTQVGIHPNFQICKIQGDLTTFMPGIKFDIVFFDAFAPEKQPEMWTREIFRRIFLSLNPGGILTTYCVKGTVKRMLKEAGFMVEKLPGPPGKREMLRAHNISPQ